MLVCRSLGFKLVDQLQEVLRIFFLLNEFLNFTFYALGFSNWVLLS